MKYSASVDSSSYYAREPNPDDQWDSGESALNIHGVTVTRDDKYGDELSGSPGDTAVVLVEHYSDGDTFGSSEYAQVRGIFSNQEEAEAFAATQKTDHGYFGSFIAWLYFDVTLP